jgi:hypothetical protein
MSYGLLTIQRLTAAEALAKLTPYDDTNANTTSYMFLDINDNYTLKGIFFDDTQPENKIIKGLSVETIPDVSVPIGNTVFVTSNGSDVTGARGDLAKPFATLNAAKNAALIGDTVYVFPGTYSEFNQLHKDGVYWHFEGVPTINFFGSQMWTDGGVTTTIKITGRADINHNGVGNVIQVLDANTVLDATFFSVNGLGNQVFALNNGSGTVDVTTNITVSLVNNAVRFDGNATYKVNADVIQADSVIGISAAVYVFNSGTWTGYSVVNARLIQSGASNIYPPISSQYANQTGTLVINVSEKITKLSAPAGQAQTDTCILIMGANTIINGDIDGLDNKAIQMSGVLVKTCIHNGNAQNDGSIDLIGYGQNDIGFWLNNNGTITLNGKYSSDASESVTHGGAASKMFFSGEVNNQSADVAAKSCIWIKDNAGPVIFGQSKLIMNLAVGNEVSIDTDSVDAQDIKIQGTLGTNAAANVNINNLIGGTALIVDAQYE